MKQFKKLAMLIAGLWYCMAMNAHAFEVDGIYYNILTETEVEITFCGPFEGTYDDEYTGMVEIPKSVNRKGKTYSVTSIGNHAFYNCDGLTSITIPNFVTSIGIGAFSGCSGLTSITVDEGNAVYDSRENCNAIIEKKTNRLISGCKNTSIPNSVTSIGDYAFKGCSGLTSITIPNSVTSIGVDAFTGCTGLASITIPNSVTSIGDYAFYSCSGLTSVTIPNSVPSIERRAFYGCTGLTSIAIPNSVTSIGDEAFQSCTNLKEVVLEDGSDVIQFGFYVFESCPIEKVYMGRSWIRQSSGIEYEPFRYIKTIVSVTIGDSITEIPSEAFWGCSNILSLTIPENVKKICSNAFYYPQKTIFLPGTPPAGYSKAIGKVNYVPNDQYGSGDSYVVYPMLNSMFEVDGITYVPTSLSERTCDIIDCVYDSQKSTVEIGETVSYKNVSLKVIDVNSYTFYKNTNLKSVSLNNQGTIGDYALSECSSLSDIELGDNITSIGNYALAECSSLSYIKLGNNITSIGEYAFENCSNLTNFILPAATQTIGKGLFSGCSVLQSLSVDANNSIYDSRDNCNAIVEKATNKLVAACNYTVIPNSVTSIGDYAFMGCQELSAISIPSSVTSLGSYAFMGCQGLSTISVPQSVTSVGDYAFDDCTNLANVIIEDRTEALALGSNGSSALFSDCPLDSVYIGGKITYNTSSSKGRSPFYKNASLRTVTITDKEDKIYDYEFSGCSALKNVTIGNGVTSIGSYAFSGCSSLESFSFGSSMQSIGESAFSGCGSIAKIVSSAVNPPVCGTSALDGINKWDCVLRVPASYMKAYQEADQWKEFLVIEDVVEVERYALKFIIDGEVYHTDSLAFSAAIVLPETPVKEGYTFGGWSEVPATMPIFDVTVEGTFTANKYNVVYKIGGVEYTTTEVSYGDSVILVDTPEKEGHTFSGWSEAPATMPAGDITVNGSFKANKYLVTFKIGEEVISADSLEYNTAVTAPEAPAKEGYTFSGWGEVADVVPAHDLAYEGSYTVNSYQLIYVVDGETIETVSVEYGTAIMLKDAPIKEGYIFSGWSEVPETMPAEDVTVEGAFTVNGIESVIANNRVDVYNLNGVMIKSQVPVEALEEELSSGIYIINGKKFMVK